MNITIPGHELLLALAGATKVLPRKTGLAILSCVRFSVENEVARLSATDLDSTLIYTFEDARIVNRGGSVIVNVNDLQRLVKGAARDSIRLIDIKPGQAEITLSGPLGERTHYLPAYNADDWPEAPQDIAVQDCGHGFISAYQKAAPFASDDETRYVLTGLRVDVEKPDSPCVVATDGRRLCSMALSPLPLESSVTLPALKFLLWNKLLGACAMGVENNRFRLRTGPWSISAKLIEGLYPNWRQVVPAEPGPDHFALHTDDYAIFCEALRTLPLRGADTKDAAIVLRESNGHIELSAIDDQGTPTLRVLPRSSASPGMTVSLNRHKLQEAVDAGFREWTLNGTQFPLCSRDGNHIHVLMPLRTEGVAPRAEPVAVVSSDSSDPSDPSDPSNKSNESDKQHHEPIPKPINQEEPHTMKPETRNQKPETRNIEPSTFQPSTSTPPALTVLSPETPAPAEPLDEVVAKAEALRETLRETSNSLRDIIALAKAQKRNDRAFRAELANARNVLVKLRDIAA
jgi:DNA polymerase III sliding clamp (beta) subunit (PCNA family)